MKNRTLGSADADEYSTTMLPELLTKKLHIYVLILPSTIKMRQNLIVNVKVIEDSNRGLGLFRKGILKVSGLLVCRNVVFSLPQRVPGAPADFFDGRITSTVRSL